MQTNGKRAAHRALDFGSREADWAGGKCLLNCHNVGQAERTISAIVGGALLTNGLRHPASLPSLLKMGLGGALLYRAATGFCGLYQALGISTAQPTDLGTLQDRQLEEARKHPDLIDEASKESFPASDPPGWTATSATRSQ